MNLRKYLLKNYKNKNILILGFGREGKSTLRIFKRYLPNQRIDIADKNLSKNYLANLTKYDCVFKSPGIPNKLFQIKDAKERGVQFTSQTRIFLEIYRDQIIGVTGTKGKSTTASLIYHILKNSGKDAELVGNIGRPVFDYLEDVPKDKLFVAELSSHQLSDVNVSPRYAIILNIFPEHLDYYESFLDYKKAKENIFRFQKKDDFYFSPETIDKVEIPKIKTKLLGQHNIHNIKAAYLVSQAFKIPFDTFIKSVATFKPVKDRLERVRTINGIEFILDGLATIPEASLAAIDAFPDRTITLILGGYDRGISFEKFGREINKRKNVKNAILIGQTAKKIRKILPKGINVYNLGFTSMENIVNKAYSVSKKNGLVLFSPACTSFDMFDDYRERDKKFRDAVKKL